MWPPPSVIENRPKWTCSKRRNWNPWVVNFWQQRSNWATRRYTGLVLRCTEVWPTKHWSNATWHEIGRRQCNKSLIAGRQSRRRQYYECNVRLLLWHIRTYISTTCRAEQSAKNYREQATEIKDLKSNHATEIKDLNKKLIELTRQLAVAKNSLAYNQKHQDSIKEHRTAARDALVQRNVARDKLKEMQSERDRCQAKYVSAYTLWLIVVVTGCMEIQVPQFPRVYCDW